MVFGIKDKKTLKEVDQMLIKAIRLFNDAASMVEDIRIDLKTKMVREKTLKIIRIATKQQEKLELLRDKIFDTYRKVK